MKRACLVVALLSVAPVAISCSSSPSGGASPSVNAIDSGTDGTVASSGGSPSGLNACQAQIKFDKRCAQDDAGASNACAAARQQNCGKFASAASNAYAAAILSCLIDSTQCGDDGTACVDAQLAMATPTAAQVKVQNDFCATCGADAGVTCKPDFFRISAVGNGPGFLILQLADTALVDLDAKCTGPSLNLAGTPGSCADAFTACATALATGDEPILPDSCVAPQPDQPDPMDDAGPAPDPNTDAGP